MIWGVRQLCNHIWASSDIIGRGKLTGHQNRPLLTKFHYHKIESVLSLILAFIFSPRGPINIHHVPRRDKDKSSDWLKFSPRGFDWLMVSEFSQWTGRVLAVWPCVCVVFVCLLFSGVFRWCFGFSWFPPPRNLQSIKTNFPVCFSVPYWKCRMWLHVVCWLHTVLCVVLWQFCLCGCVFVCWWPLIAFSFCFRLFWLLIFFFVRCCSYFSLLLMFFAVCFVCNNLHAWFAVPLLSVRPRFCLFFCRYLLPLSLLCFARILLNFCCF